MSDPNEQDVAYLRANPDVAGKFDERFGEGASTQYISATPAPEAVTEPVAVPQTDTPGGSFLRRQARQDGMPVDDGGNEEDAPTEDAFNDALSLRPGFRSLEETDDQGILGQVADVAGDLSGAIGNGLEEALNETGDFLSGIVAAGAAARSTAQGGDRDTFNAVTEVVADQLDIPDVDVFNEPVTSLGRFTSSTTQFFAGFLGAGKVTGLKGFVGSMVNGAVADGVVMNPDDPNLSAYLEANEYGPEWLTTALATDPDDPEWLNRMRNVTEGAVLGGATDLVLLGFRSIAKGAQAAKMEAGPARDAVAREAEELAEEVADLSELAMREGVPANGSPSPYKSVSQLMEDARARREGREPVQVETPTAVREEATPMDRVEGRLESDAEGRPAVSREEPNSPSSLVDDDALMAAVRSSDDVTVETLI